MKQFFLLHRLEQIKESPDIIAVGGEVVGAGEIDDLSSVPQRPQPPGHIAEQGKGRTGPQQVAQGQGIAP